MWSLLAAAALLTLAACGSPAKPEEYLTIWGETKAVSVIVAEERARIEQYGYTLGCVAANDVFQSLMPHPTADEARYLVLLKGLCAEFRKTHPK